jgi:hypothetical protein
MLLALLVAKSSGALQLSKPVLNNLHCCSIICAFYRVAPPSTMQAKQYIGVPYAQRYHEPGTPDFAAPLFLGMQMQLYFQLDALYATAFSAATV